MATKAELRKERRAKELKNPKLKAIIATEHCLKDYQEGDETFGYFRDGEVYDFRMPRAATYRETCVKVNGEWRSKAVMALEKKRGKKLLPSQAKSVVFLDGNTANADVRNLRIKRKASPARCLKCDAWRIMTPNVNQPGLCDDCREKHIAKLQEAQIVC